MTAMMTAMMTVMMTSVVRIMMTFVVRIVTVMASMMDDVHVMCKQRLLNAFALHHCLVVTRLLFL